MNNDQPEHLNGLCRSALHYLCLIKAFVTKFNFERVEEVHGIVSIDSRLLHYTRVVLISIYRVCCWKGQKVHKKLHTINNSSKIDRNIWKLKPSYSQ